MNATLMKKQLYTGFLVACFLFVSCEVPTENFDNPLDSETAEEEGFETPALVFFPDEVSVNVGGSVTLEVFAMEVENLAGSHIQLDYDKNKLQLLSLNPGDLFAGASELIFLYEDDPATGTIDIFTSFLGDDTVSVSGTGSLASLVMTTTTTGQSTVTYSTECELVDPDDVAIEIKGFGVGVVNAQ
jgi:hypothetical protein